MAYVLCSLIVSLVTGFSSVSSMVRISCDIWFKL